MSSEGKKKEDLEDEKRREKDKKKYPRFLLQGIKASTELFIENF